MVKLRARRSAQTPASAARNGDGGGRGPGGDAPLDPGDGKAVTPSAPSVTMATIFSSSAGL